MGDCYRRALREVMSGNRANARLCHGWPVMSEHAPQWAGHRFGHAWVEYDHEVLSDELAEAMGMPHAVVVRYAYDPTTDTEIPAGMYRNAGRIEQVTVYTPEAAARLAVETRIAGPWTDDCPTDLPLANGDGFA